jgi:pimeloyl-ACP methyl ester carboxylesterase
MALATPKERTFTYNEMTFHALEWGEPGGAPVLALHGWLDNAASFYRLAPRLEGCHVIALDMAGHGRSDHRPGIRPYNILDDISEIYAIADQMGWQQFNIMGHSRGAIMSMLTAGTFPERILAVGLIDGLWPPAVQAADAPAQLAQSIEDNQNPKKVRFRVYDTVEHMKTALLNSKWRYSSESADALLERGVKSVEGGYTWSSSPHLRTASAFKLTQAHIEAFVKRISAPVRLIIAKEGLSTAFADYQEDIAEFNNIQVTVLPGGHHLHMEEQALKIAEIFTPLFTEGK